MIVDTSAIVSIIRNEIEAQQFTTILERVGQSFITSPNYLELCMVVTGNKVPQALQKLNSTLSALGVTIIPFTAEMAVIAVHAFEQFGKGRDPQAALNFGDCMSYAASKAEAMPLLFKGDDFRHTDVECAI